MDTDFPMTEAALKALSADHRNPQRRENAIDCVTLVTNALLVARLAAITHKYQGTTAVPGYDRRSTDRLMTELTAALERSEDTRQRVVDSEEEPS